MGIYVVANTLWPVDIIYSKAFNDYSYLYKIWYLHLTMQGRRFQFYSVFRFMELGCVASGLGYRGRIEGKDQWDSVVAAYGWRTELTASP